MNETLCFTNITLSIDKEGNWRHEGVRITHEKTISLFFSALDREENGRYFIQVGNEKAYVNIDDAPFVATSLRMTKEGIRLTFQDNSREILDPETLWFTSENIPYCKIRNRKMTAKLSRTAYYELAEYISEDGDGFVLTIKGKKFINHNL